MPNQIDGIRKLNKEELERSRKIVLDSIAEETRPDAPVVAPKNKSRLVDGVFSRPAVLAVEKKPEKKHPDKIETEEKKTAPVPESPEERQRKAELRSSWRKEVESAMGASPRSGADEKKSFPKTRPEIKPAPAKKTEEKRKEEKRPGVGALKEKARAAEEEARKKEEVKKEEKRREEIRKAEELEKKRREQAETKKRETRAAGKRKRQAKINALKNKILSGRNHLIATFFTAGRRAFYFFSLMLLVFIFLYSAFAVLLLKFNVDNKFTRYVAGYVVVPAIITNGNVVDYYKYVDVRAGLKDKVGPDRLDEASRLAIARGMIINSLVKKYNLSATDDISEKINKNIILDGDINVVAVNRMMKIKKMIDSGEDFIRTATRYGDDLGPLTISEENKSDRDYYEKLLSLEVGGNSEIIINEDGYYIFHMFGKTENKADLTYVVVRPMLFEEFMSESVKNYKVWSLID